MNNAFNNRLLFLIFLGSCLLYAGVSWVDKGRAQGNYKTVLVQVDSSLISKVEIRTKKEDELIILERTENSWIGKRGNTESLVDHNSINALLAQIYEIKVKRVAAMTAERWNDFEIADTSAKFVKAYAGNKKVIDLFVGSFDYQPQPQSVTTFVREPGEEIVYGIDGLLSMNIDRNFQSYRNRSFLQFDAGNVTSLQVSQGANSMNIQKSLDGWTANGQLIDSTAVKNYLKTLARLDGDFFEDGFQSTQPMNSLIIRGNNMNEIQVNAFPGPNNDFVVQSSMYPKSFYQSDSTGLYQKVFLGLETLKSGE